MNTSALNQVPGVVKTIKKGPVSTEVIIPIAGAGEMDSSLTRTSAEN